MYLQCRYKKGKPMQTQIQKWGNSLAVRIPKTMAEEAKIIMGSVVEVKVESGNIVIVPSKRKYLLEDLLLNITEDNLHEEIDTGVSVGKEEF